MANLLEALLNISALQSFSLPAHYGGANRMNNMGVALEYFVKDAFCGTFSTTGVPQKDRVHSRQFSYIGNANNPPDFIVRGGDAVEVKKIENPNSGLALNSSYPKSKLHSDNPLITDACRSCEQWTEKDIIYAVGVVQDETISSLWFVYGDCYAANRSVYERIKTSMAAGINSIEGVQFSPTRELARVNRVDPLGITYLRVRGMWGIENPMTVFEGLRSESRPATEIVALMRQEKYTAFSAEERTALEKKGWVADAEIKDPDNPANYLHAKIIKISLTP